MLYPKIDFCPDWSRIGVHPLAQRDYLESELIRVGKLGAPLLTTTMMAPLPIQAEMGISILSSGSLGKGSHWLQWRLCLVPEEMRKASIRWRDADGKLLEPEKRGKVLRVKVGTVGGQIQRAFEQPREVLVPFAGEALANSIARGESIHLHVDIDERPRQFQFQQAMSVLRRFGFGIPRVQFPRQGESRPIKEISEQDRLDMVDPDLRHVRMRSTDAPCRVDDWAVGEIPQDWATPPREEAPAPEAAPKAGSRAQPASPQGKG